MQHKKSASKKSITASYWAFALLAFSACFSIAPSTSMGAGLTGEDVAVQPDGRIVIAGTSTSGSSSDFAIKRYTPAGAEDLSFAPFGEKHFTFGTQDEKATSVAVQSDGRIVVAGTTQSVLSTDTDFALARYWPDGTPDTSFGTSAGIKTNITTLDTVNDVVLTSSGKVIVAGSIKNAADSSNKFAIARYNSNGTLDTSFGTNGIYSRNITTYNDEAFGISLIPGGDMLVVVGYSVGTTSDNMVMARINGNGTQDNTFDGDGNSDGLIYTNFSTGEDRGSTVLVQPDGKILAGGWSWVNSTNDIDFAIARYNADGSADTSWNSNGRLTMTRTSGPDKIYDLGVDSQGKVLIAGTQQTPGAPMQFVVGRRNADGTRDTSFSSDGWDWFNSYCSGSTCYDSGASSLSVLPDDSMIATGTSKDQQGNSYAITAKYSSTGAPISSFGTGGRITSGPAEVAPDSSEYPVPHPPVNLALPNITGSYAEDSIISATDGTWKTHGNQSVSYQWSTCNTTCTDIQGATNNTYHVSPQDNSLTVKVTMTDDLGATTVQSNTLHNNVLPKSLEPPIISGEGVEGSTIVVDKGNWTSEENLIIHIPVGYLRYRK